MKVKMPTLKKQVADLTSKVAGFEEEKKAILQAADEEVEEKISLAWNSHFTYGSGWFLDRYRWASQLYYYRQGICDPPISLRNLYLKEDNQPLEPEEGQGDERFDREKIEVPEPVRRDEEEEDESPDDQTEPPEDKDESPDA